MSAHRGPGPHHGLEWLAATGAALSSGPATAAAEPVRALPGPRRRLLEKVAFSPNPKTVAFSPKVTFSPGGVSLLPAVLTLTTRASVAPRHPHRIRSVDSPVKPAFLHTHPPALPPPSLVPALPPGRAALRVPAPAPAISAKAHPEPRAAQARPARHPRGRLVLVCRYYLMVSSCT